jgi:ABC-2 type transport system permease protein
MRTLVRLSWVNLKLFLREPLTVVFSLALPLIILFVLGGVFGNETIPQARGQVVFRGVGPMSYYLPAYVALVVLSGEVVPGDADMGGQAAVRRACQEARFIQ